MSGMSTRKSVSISQAPLQPPVLEDEHLPDVDPRGGVSAGDDPVPDAAPSKKRTVSEKRGKQKKAKVVKQKKAKVMSLTELRSLAAARNREWNSPPPVEYSRYSVDADDSSDGEPSLSREGAVGSVKDANETVENDDYLGLSVSELHAWFKENGESLSVKNTLIVGDILARVSAYHVPPSFPVSSSSVTPASSLSSGKLNGNTESVSCAFVCFDGFTHETTSKSTSVLSSYARDYNADIAYWRLLRVTDRSEAITLVTTPTSPHTLSASALRLWLAYYTPMPPADRHFFLVSASAELNLLGDLGFLADRDAFAGIVAFDWGVMPHHHSKMSLSARHFAGTRAVADASGSPVYSRCLEFDSAVRENSLRTVEAVRVISNWVTCLMAVTLNPEVYASYVRSGLGDSLVSACETLTPVIALSKVWRAIATTTDMLRHDYRSSTPTPVGEPTLFPVLRARDSSVTDWLFQKLVASLVLPTGVFYDATRAASTAKSYFLEFVPVPPTQRTRDQMAAPKSDAGKTI